MTVRTSSGRTVGQHFAAISGAGPLVGPILAAQMGYLPSVLWIILGVIFAGAVQDMLMLWISAKRQGRSFGQMATDEMGKFGGIIISLFLVVVTAIAMAFLALVAIKAMASSPWAVFSLGMTIPIALVMGCYERFLRPGKVIETTILGFVLLVLAIVGAGSFRTRRSHPSSRSTPSSSSSRSLSTRSRPQRCSTGCW